jgi:hypothetical protein
VGSGIPQQGEDKIGMEPVVDGRYPDARPGGIPIGGMLRVLSLFDPGALDEKGIPGRSVVDPGNQEQLFSGVCMPHEVVALKRQGEKAGLLEGVRCAVKKHAAHLDDFVLGVRL